MCFIPPRDQSPQQMEKGDPPPSLCILWKVSPSSPAPQMAPSFPVQQQDLQGVDKAPQIQQVRAKEMPARCARGARDHSPRCFPASGCSGCFIIPSTGWELSLQPLLTDKLLIDDKLSSMPLLAGTGNPENHGRNHFTEKPSCFKRADPDRGTVS